MKRKLEETFSLSRIKNIFRNMHNFHYWKTHKELGLLESSALDKRNEIFFELLKVIDNFYVLRFKSFGRESE